MITVVVAGQGRAFGFDGKTLIHPKTIDTANKHFGPTDEDLENAREVIAAYETAQVTNKSIAEHTS